MGSGNANGKGKGQDKGKASNGKGRVSNAWKAQDVNEYTHHGGPHGEYGMGCGKGGRKGEGKGKAKGKGKATGKGKAKGNIKDIGIGKGIGKGKGEGKPRECRMLELLADTDGEWTYRNGFYFCWNCGRPRSSAHTYKAYPQTCTIFDEDSPAYSMWLKGFTPQVHDTDSEDGDADGSEFL
eukprot:TRINITY_DN72300_c0_g1_i1.p1 TRINITY_DN72300_c0_g1~~TRINITY_DN72300_c0_g1_i1.p1  ORF type:complete len:199 (-),score=22.12 TRINITY_DN72300_c0_g1_i1:255-797(-)